MYRFLPALLALASMGCATAASALLGAALCGDSGECREDFVRAGVATDVAVGGAIAQSAIEEARRDRRSLNGEYDFDVEGEDPAEPQGELTTGGEYTTPGASERFACVDARGHHVLETWAPSELEARLTCANELGVGWGDPSVNEVCDCSTPR